MKPKLIAGVPTHEKGSFHDTESVRFSQDDQDIIDQ